TELYTKTNQLSKDEPTIAYCRIGERSSLTWFALKYLLGFKNVKNYDGSWTEWGNLVGAPVEKPGSPKTTQSGSKNSRAGRSRSRLTNSATFITARLPTWTPARGSRAPRAPR